MATKNLTITKEAYEQLRKHKRDDESFTETILRLTGENRDVMAGFGLLADDDTFPEATTATRAELDSDLRERRDR
ncbi:hypothetical protein BRD20_04190 [Halobacteriales archaeon SW_8_65_20]|nr:MAG: hypothetical protein BRC71_01660 [Halobacteriales archaeon QH_7_65_31]PSQ30841.1 MAG: hypothetical protein BRD16_06350 [Halobacteriales archaeon SW_6_65_46]PSQ53120.1 MAG: hypothetical protein BRD20_04190 [Halobacteriales archaeon SW_8_65_20]